MKEEIKRKQKEIDLAEAKSLKIRKQITEESNAVTFTEKLFILSKERPGGRYVAACSIFIVRSC